MRDSSTHPPSPDTPASDPLNSARGSADSQLEHDDGAGHDDGAEKASPMAELSQADLMSFAGAANQKERSRERNSWVGAGIPEREPDSDPLLGTTLHDTYVISRVLGEGGMGRVYEARHTRISTKRYAIKVLHSEFSLDAGIRLRFQREAEAAATIEHDGVVGTYDIGRTPQGWPYMVCEYLAGEDLNDYLKRSGQLPPRTVVHIGRQLCGALRAAHARGVIHRDLKPHNVFVLQTPADSRSAEHENSDSHPTVKILDFGLSRFVETDSELTKTGIILGTPGYMAPEQAHGRETDARTDIYGIGALLYATATGQPPFKEETPQLTVLAVMGREPQRPRVLAPSLPVGLEIVIQKAMARNSAERYQSAAEMGEALERLYSASTRLDRRDVLERESRFLSPRVSLVVYVTSAFCLGGLSLLLCLLALLDIKGVEYAKFRPSLLEGLLISVLCLLLIFPLYLLVRHFKRKTWDNSAKVAALVPQVRAPLVAATLAYGLSALLIYVTAGVFGLAGVGLRPSQVLSETVLYLVLPLNALLAAGAVLVRQGLREVPNLFLKAVIGLGISSAALAAGLLLLVLPFTFTPAEKTISPTPGVKAEDSAQPTHLEQSKFDTQEESDANDRVTEAKNSPIRPSATFPAARAPKEDLAISQEKGTEALAALAQKYPSDDVLLKALVLAYASRADSFNDAVKTIGRLVTVAPTSKKDSDVLFILKKALVSQGSAHQVAASTVVSHFGPEGAELIYDAMAENPKQISRLREIFHELRKKKLASQEVLVAYDLRYATSCKARLAFLDRAEKYGDLRSLHQLQALSTASKRCGWGRTCYPPCRAEAEAFKKSAREISRRLEPTPSQ